MSARDVAALVVAVDPLSCGQINYKQFVRKHLERAPAHLKLLESSSNLGFETQHEKWGTSPITVCVCMCVCI